MKYATIGAKTLIKLINTFYMEKYTTNKHKCILLEVLVD